MPDLVPEFKGKVYSYLDVISCCLSQGPGIGLPVYRGLMSGWDNTARRGYHSHIFDGGTPENYEVWLRRLLDYTRRHHQGDHRLVFVNAWNEWGEGAYLEPDERFGYGFLEATARAVFAVPTPDALIATLRQINAGHAEALTALDELEHAVRINQSIVNLVDAKKLLRTDSTRTGFVRPFSSRSSGRACGFRAKVDSTDVTGLSRRAQFSELRRRRQPESILRPAPDGMDRDQPCRGPCELTDPVSALQSRERRPLCRPGAVPNPTGRRGRASQVAARVSAHVGSVRALQRLSRLSQHYGRGAGSVQTRRDRARGRRPCRIGVFVALGHHRRVSA